ncbi:McrC family protein [Salinarimonas rosea]|uniref:McrC family protein n=1 Tax=Salinarimonas rosea TaxID=552063 RepID=UPI0004067265|nr:McrC family protein [Salinarimonas rosea]
MIRRSVSEWAHIAYGEGPEEIPRFAADRIAATARISPLAGASGTGVLEHGRTGLRARNIVGVIAAEGCSLEILPKIDGLDGEGAVRRRLVRMLAVALDLDLAAGRLTALDEQREDLLEILIRLFAERLTEAVRRGMPRAYVPEEGDLTALRGRLDLIRQSTTLLATPQKLACRYDALSPDIALNQVMRAAVGVLAGHARREGTRRLLRELAFVYADVALAPPGRLPFDRIHLDRGNMRWRDLVELAQLLLGGRYQTTSFEPRRGFSLLFDMNALFEAYIARLLARALRPEGLTVVAQGGRRFCLTHVATGTEAFQTRPDLIIRRGDAILLVADTKWKRLAPRIDDAKQGVSQADVYQMMAYGRLYACPRLALLYPHHPGLGADEGLSSRHRVADCADEIAILTHDLTREDDALERLRTGLASMIGTPSLAAATGL